MTGATSFSVRPEYTVIVPLTVSGALVGTAVAVGGAFVGVAVGAAAVAQAVATTAIISARDTRVRTDLFTVGFPFLSKSVVTSYIGAIVQLLGEKREQCRPRPYYRPCCRSGAEACVPFERTDRTCVPSFALP